MGGYRISELAERTGFPASTLRFYEQEGLLPVADRTPGGYRSYDERAVRRLTFIARAKQLGLPLEEIRELAVVWDAGSCAPVQERLVALLTGRIAEAAAQIEELRAFHGQLLTARNGLGRHTPDGPCDGDCGCVSPTVGSGNITDTRQAVRLLPSRPGAYPPIDPAAIAGAESLACTLTDSDQRTRVEEWGRLLASATDRESVVDGIRWVLPADADLIGEMARLAVLEQGCCGFLDFTIELSAGAVALTVRAAANAAGHLATSEAVAFLDAIFDNQR